MAELHQRAVTPVPATPAPAKTPSRSKPKEYTREEIEKWETEKETIAYEFSPTTVTAWRLFLAVQLVAAAYNYISDCDEVFNYWEPTHFLQYGRGLQTWEYSPQWALRSYFFLLPQFFVGKIFEAIEANKMIQFFAMRAFIGVVTALSQTYFYYRIRGFFRGRIAFMTLIFMTISPGFFVAGTAFLPSTFAMCFLMIAHGLWMAKSPSYFWATFMVAVAALLALVGAPLALDALRKVKVKFILYAVFSAIVILVPSVMYDSYLYGVTVIAAKNIVQYNVFGGGSSALYGVESATWYFKNVAINFNLVSVFAVLSVPVALLSQGIRLRSKDFLRSILMQLGVYLWFGFMSAIPHKEERFLFVIYGPLCLAGAIGFVGFFDFVFETLHKCFSQGFSSRVAGFGAITVALLIILLSFSRSYSTYHNYGAPLKIYGDLFHLLEADDCWEGNEQINICVGKEWYRFTSSYFLPGNRFNLTFIDQGPTSLYFPLRSSDRLPNFNDQNREEMSRYIPLEFCHFVVDYDPEGLGNVGLSAEEWTTVSSYPFLESSRSSNALLRAFYIPYVSDKSNQFGRYVLLQRRSTVDSKVPHCCRLTMGTASIERPAYPTVVRGEQPSASSTQDQAERTRLASEKRERERHEKEERAKSEEEAQRTREREAAKAQQAAADKERHEDEERRRMIEEYEAKLAAESEQREAESDAKAVQQESEELHKKWEDIKQTEAELDASPSGEAQPATIDEDQLVGLEQVKAAQNKAAFDRAERERIAQEQAELELAARENVAQEQGEKIALEQAADEQEPATLEQEAAMPAEEAQAQADRQQVAQEAADQELAAHEEAQAALAQEEQVRLASDEVPPVATEQPLVVEAQPQHVVSEEPPHHDRHDHQDDHSHDHSHEHPAASEPLQEQPKPAHPEEAPTDEADDGTEEASPTSRTAGQQQKKQQQQQQQAKKKKGGRKGKL